MPTPDRTSLDAIVHAARGILESEGLAGLTMQAVAQQVGVRAPSLYKRVDGRDELIRLVAEATLTDLAARLSSARDLGALATSFRSFGHEWPAAFQLVMSPGAGNPVARPKFGATASEPVLALAGEIAGDKHALEAARTVTSWAVGFVSMELNGNFALGGDIDEAWRFGVERIVAALATPQHPA